MKRIVMLTLCMLFLFGSFASASSVSERVNNILNNKPPDSTIKIAVVLSGDRAMLSEESIGKLIDQKFEKKFPKNNYQVVKDNKVYQELLTIAEDKDIVNLDRLKRNDFVAAGKKYGYDYVILFPFYNEGGYYSGGSWTNFVKITVTLRARIVDVNSGEYVYRLDVSKQGEAANGFGLPSMGRAQRDGVRQCIDEVFKDIAIGAKFTDK